MLVPKLINIFIYICNKKYQFNDIKRFISKIKINKEKGCWEWTDGLDKDGYGRFTYYNNGKQINCRSHRVAYETCNRELIPEGMCVCHTCDNPSCCNPKHLFLGTKKDNMNDRDNKNRQAKGNKVGTAKLNWDKVKEIRNLYNNCGYTLESIGVIYNVENPTIGKIIRNETWYDSNYIQNKIVMGNSKITLNVAKNIRILYNTNEYTQVQLAKIFGIKQAAISKIIKNITWKIPVSKEYTPMSQRVDIGEN
jgi:DNA-binding XRE family transcriptional regulator